MIKTNKFGFWKCFVCRKMMRNCGWAKISHLQAHVRSEEMSQKQLDAYRKMQNMRGKLR